MKIRGVNLGNWLVLEKWMKPSMFDGVEAEDETYLCKYLTDIDKKRRYQEHRQSYITEEDFRKIANMGLDMVRIPVPYSLFEDIGSFLHCYEFLDQAFLWAEKAGLKILIDLHTVPGGHNGTDNSGICGVCTWSTKTEYLEMTLDVLEKIAERYGTMEALWGVEVLNEPMCRDTPLAGHMNIQWLSQIYKAKESELTEKSENYSLSYLKGFYRSAYERIRKHMPEEKRIVFSDAFYLEGWEEFFKEEHFQNIVLDTHQYLTMVEYGFGEERPLEKYEAYLAQLAEKLEKASANFQVIVGEWSMSNIMTGYEDAGNEEKANAFRKLYKAYRKAVDKCDGWFYWTYKLQADEPEKALWDMRACIENGWIELEQTAEAE